MGFNRNYNITAQFIILRGLNEKSYLIQSDIPIILPTSSLIQILKFQILVFLFSFLLLFLIICLLFIYILFFFLQSHSKYDYTIAGYDHATILDFCVAVFSFILILNILVLYRKK